MAFLEKVTIHNFRNVAYKELVLNTKNIVRGKNMSGKTNTLNAIHWALTGTTIDGNSDNRSNFTKVDVGVATPEIRVKLDFGDFVFERVCENVEGTPSISIYIDGQKTTSIKNGEARLHAKLGLSDFVINQPKGFDIVKFLLNPLYFESVDTSALRKFFYNLADFDYRKLSTSKKVYEVLEKYKETDPYKLGAAIATEKKKVKAKLTTCKGARDLFPSILSEIEKVEKDESAKLMKVEADEALANKYALQFSNRINMFYEKAMGIKVCVLEEGVGDDVFKDVCYPILPKSNLPFRFGSYAERSFVGMRFIQEVCLKWNIKPLPILLDNMESLDESTQTYVDDLGAQYIGALVE